MGLGWAGLQLEALMPKLLPGGKAAGVGAELFPDPGVAGGSGGDTGLGGAVSEARGGWGSDPKCIQLGFAFPPTPH